MLQNVWEEAESEGAGHDRFGLPFRFRLLNLNSESLLTRGENFKRAIASSRIDGSKAFLDVPVAGEVGVPTDDSLNGLDVMVVEADGLLRVEDPRVNKVNEGNDEDDSAHRVDNVFF